MLWPRRHHTVLKISKDCKVKRTWQFCSQTVVLKSICNGGRSTAPSSSRSVMVMSGYGWLNWTAENSPFYTPFLRKILQQSRAGKEVYFSLLSEFYQIGPVKRDFFFSKKDFDLPYTSIWRIRVFIFGTTLSPLFTSL